MHRASIGAIVVFFLLAPGPPLFGQYNPYAPVRPPNADPRIRRAPREQAGAYAGPNPRELVETGGDEAVAAIFACSPSGARNLVQFYASGALAKLPRPPDLLRVIAVP